jgi:glycine dehydrogenase subunit 1
VETFSYVPHTPEDRKKMMTYLGISDTNELFSDIPEQIRMQQPLNLPTAMSELTLDRHMQSYANKNLDFSKVTSFLGAGAYEHYQPSVVDAIIGRSEFYTSYTPYQPEISQGMLQAIFEYQTMVCELTGMDIANASMYDGPTALAEAGIVCCAQTRRNKLLVAGSVHPEYREVLRTYAAGQSIDVVELDVKSGTVDLNALSEYVNDEVAGVLIQYPNFFGCIEDVQAIAQIAHDNGALVVVNTYPVALGVLETPGALGADIVVAEGQSLGNSVSFGGPYLGVMAVRKELMRRLPGRIVGQTRDSDGNLGYVLTLQAREQHIRREKASSNICSNQALNALAATVYMSYMGKSGMEEVALQNYHKAHYLQSLVSQLPGVEVPFEQPFFNEFVIRLPKASDRIQNQLLDLGILFGLNLQSYYPDLKDCVLVNVTEVRTREEMDTLVKELEGLL